ncbi:antibiotic biosynthesis monooxygenase [Herbaspirillum sp. WKF16]|uniref:putative quinol monooxygenase n=1 Tax=Herbaspirillum sp. WKF16 TaxID=3028312 RepID=UPI0023A9DB7A|nr:antibiotic biosynthesis monooxygenase family protein [Herbaspirillum sp. WKF16]WDZ95935.1 antibiotic biosynthesis monooxygenase [Herbaspirillum sp. WKF16]
MQGPIIVVATITARPGHREAVTAALKKAVLLVRSEPGCERYDLHRDDADADRLVMLERWDSAEDLARHEQGEPFKELVKELTGRADLAVSKLEQLA